MSMTRKFTNTEKKFDKSEIVSDIMSVFKAKEPSEVVPEMIPETTEVTPEKTEIKEEESENEELEVVAETETPKNEELEV